MQCLVRYCCDWSYIPLFPGPSVQCLVRYCCDWSYIPLFPGPSALCLVRYCCDWSYIPLFPGSSVQCLVRYCCDKVIHTSVSRALSAVSCQIQMFWHWWTWARHFQELRNGPQESSVSEQCFILLPVPKGFVPLTFLSFSVSFLCAWYSS